ncbi:MULTISPECIES: hypothetical protein [unclassified Nonomuraea]|uniref:hypothetical protein n=1 Tax=Nonomuraea sp. NPDC049725 TaxID=3154508 RepID=UPI00341BA346
MLSKMGSLADRLLGAIVPRTSAAAADDECVVTWGCYYWHSQLWYGKKTCCPGGTGSMNCYFERHYEC